MKTHTISLTQALAVGGIVSPYHLGANTIYTKDYLDPGGPFNRLFDNLNFGLLRFPGGTVTEERLAPGNEEVDRLFDIRNSSGYGIENQGRIVTAPSFFDFSNEKDTAIQFVIPTENYFGTLLDEDGFRSPSSFGFYQILNRVDAIIRGTYGDVNIDTFIIGNEFWYRNERLAADEYGKIANDVSIGLDRVFAQYATSVDAPNNWEAPQIGIQVSQGWRPEQNTQILERLTLEARDVIDVLIQHFYPTQYHQVANSPGTFDRLDDFHTAEGFGDLKYYISEWNTSVRDDADTGLLQSSTMLEIMHMMLSRDVDYASVWGTQYLNLPNRLSALTQDNSDPSGFTTG